VSALDSKFADGAFHRHSRVVAGVLSETGEGIEKGSFACIRITNDGNNVTTLYNAVRNGRMCRKGSRRCGNGHKDLILPSQRIKHNTPGFVAT
jgi:hypothetical protein